MSVSLYSQSVPIFSRAMNNLSNILDKAEAHAQARKFDSSVLLQARLYPDMFPLLRQVMLVSDFAKGPVARLAGQEPPKYEDTETTIPELKARLAKTIAFIESFKPEQIDGAETRPIVVKMRGEDRHFVGLTYLNQAAMPNFYFHATTAYAILRHNGVEIGKVDFIGKL